MSPAQPRGPRPPAPATEPLGAPLAPRAPVIERAPLAPGAPPPVEPVPPVGPEPPWWRDGSGTIVVGVVALIVGALIGALIGGSGGNANRTVTERNANAQQTVTHTVTVVHPKVVVHTRTVTVTSAAKTPPAVTPGGNGESEETRSFTGSGSKTIGTLTLSRRSALEWTSDGQSLQVSATESVLVNSGAHSGTTSLEPGTYRNVQVNADGNWTIKIVPK
jgi:hypothetical protein